MFDQILEFSANHTLLVTALLISASLLILNLLSGNKGNITPVMATELINHENAVVVDVRPAADFSQGHIINSINIPATTLSGQINQLNKYKDRPIIVSCRSGAQSSAACKQLIKEGFENVHNLKGGILNWQSENLPVTKKK
ncbi:MAG: rhodanese-like domain-containing protein [Gammaproteobacteria bacterium]|jgi:rhodanese-related sulfurtransferase